MEQIESWGRQIEATGESLRTIGKQLRSLGAASAADLAERVADYASGCGTYLQDAAFIVGMAGARMLKAGSSRRYERYGNQPSWQS
jgi:hypothetical protein